MQDEKENATTEAPAGAAQHAAADAMTEVGIQQEFAQIGRLCSQIAQRITVFAGSGVKTPYLEMCQYEATRRVEETMHRVQDIAAALASQTPEVISRMAAAQKAAGTLRVLEKPQ